MRLGRVYIALSGGSTLSDLGTCRFPEPFRLEPEMTEADVFGRRAVRFLNASLAVQLLQTNEAVLQNVLDSPLSLYRVFLSPAPLKYGSSVSWSTALSDRDGVALDNVYVRPSLALGLDGTEVQITLRFSKRYIPILSLGPEVVDSALFYHEFYDSARALYPFVGSVGAYTRSGSIPVWDIDGRIKTYGPNELPYSRTPLGDWLPMINPATTNRIANNSDANTATATALSYGTGSSWENFTLRPRIPNTTNTQHYSERSYSGSEWQNGRIVNYSFVYRPLVGQTTAAITVTASVGGRTVSIDLGTGAATTLTTSGTPPDLLKTWSLPVFGGYYWVGAAMIYYNIGSSTSVAARAHVVDASGNVTFAGDGTRAYDTFGADMFLLGSELVIFPPCAPIRTTGSPAGVSAGVLSFPFSDVFTSEGLTFFLETELSLVSANFYPVTLWVLGNGDTTVGGTYSPFGVFIHGTTCRFNVDGQGIVTTTFTTPRLALTANMTTTGTTHFINLNEIATTAETRSAPLSPSPEMIEFKTGGFGPFWLRRYGVFRGLIHPRKFLE